MNGKSMDPGTCQKASLMNRMICSCGKLTQELNRRLRQEFSLSLPKYDVLQAIDCAENNEITMSDLSRELFVSNANMTGMISRLQSENLIEKKILPSDRRICSVRLTDEGRQKLHEASEKHDIWIREFMSDINEDQLDNLNDFLDKIDR